jgi:hypothetical protein
MAKNPRYANCNARRKLSARLRAEGRGCWICRAFGKPGTIDYSLPAGHPYSFEVDELIPVSKGGSPTSRANVDAAHRCCNQWRSDKSVEQVLEIARGGKGKAKASKVERVEGVTSSLSG